MSHLVAVAATEYVLHTSEDRETLVRAILDLYCTHKFAAQENCVLLLEVAPNANVVGTSTKVESLDNARPMQQIWGALVGSGNLEETVHVQVDLSSMRKMQKGDQIVFRDSTVQENGYHISGRITLFFKE